MGEQLPEQRTVGQAGQAVVVDQVLHAFFGGAQHADVGENDEGVADGIGVVAHRADRDRLGKQFAVLALADNLAVPGTACMDGLVEQFVQVVAVHA